MKSDLAEDPKLKAFSIRIRCTNPLELAPLPSFLCGCLNTQEFEGRASETVLFIGPEKGARDNFADPLFLEHPISFNKLLNVRTSEWDRVFHQASGKPLYELADFSQLSAVKLAAT